jgi:hypothetical protein
MAGAMSAALEHLKNKVKRVARSGSSEMKTYTNKLPLDGKEHQNFVVPTMVV